MRSTWADSRIDDLSEKVAAQTARIDSMNHTLLVVGGGVLAAIIGLTAAMLGLIATQL